MHVRALDWVHRQNPVAACMAWGTWCMHAELPYVGAWMPCAFWGSRSPDMHRHGFPFLWDIEGVAGLKTEIVFLLTFSCYTVILSCATTPRVDDKQHRDKGLGEALPPSVSVQALIPYHSSPIICCVELQLACWFRASPQVCSLLPAVCRVAKVQLRVGPVNPAAQNEAYNSAFARLQVAWAPTET
jgi:hypothetical protein